MANRKMIKDAIDDVPAPCLDGLYLIVTAMQKVKIPHLSQTKETWPEFLERTYGSLADTPIERADQGDFEKHDTA